MTVTEPAILRGPADPERFRLQVGRYRERWYTDPLPTCPIATATPDTEAYPSVTNVIGTGWPKHHLVGWAATEAAKFAYDNQPLWTQLPRDAAVPLITAESDRIRDRAADNGTLGHQYIEALANGQTDLASMLAGNLRFAATARRAVDELRPRYILSEVVVIKRGPDGYGGTFDGIWDLDLPQYGLVGRYGVDFNFPHKNRTDAYPEKGAQLAAYMTADYMIVGVDGHAVRAEIPHVDGALVVVINGDDYAVTPVNLDAAHAAFQACRRFWATLQAGTEADGRVLGRKVHIDPNPPTSPPVVAPQATGPATVNAAAVAGPPVPTTPGEVVTPPVATAPGGDSTVLLCSRPASESRVLRGQEATEFLAATLPPTTTGEVAAVTLTAATLPAGGLLDLARATPEPEHISTLLPQVIAEIPDEPVGPPPAPTVAEVREVTRWVEGQSRATDDDPTAPNPTRRAWAIERRNDINTAGHLELLAHAWPAGVPGLLTDHQHTNAELDQIALAFAAVERHHELPFPPADPGPELVAADDPRVTNILDGFRALPVDLQADLRTEIETHQYPMPSTGRCTSTQVALITGWLKAIEARWDARMDQVDQVGQNITEAGADRAGAVFLATGGRTDDESLLTEREVYVLAAIVLGVRGGWLAADLTVADGLVDRVGGKAALLKTARQVCVAEGRATPLQSSDDVTADPVLVALIAAATDVPASTPTTT